MKKRRRQYAQYLIVRTRKLLGYVEYFGPMVSTWRQAERDAQRLFGKMGYDVIVKAWSKVPAKIRKLCKEPNWE